MNMMNLFVNVCVLVEALHLPCLIMMQRRRMVITLTSQLNNMMMTTILTTIKKVQMKKNLLNLLAKSERLHWHRSMYIILKEVS